MQRGTPHKYNYLFIKLLILFICITTSNIAFSQLTDYGQNPPGIRWKKMETPRFRILFPESLGEEAQRTANLLEHFGQSAAGSLHPFPEKTPILLQNQTVISNGFVSLGPKRAELFTTPPQDNEPTDWMGRLAVHELRHVAQINHVIRTKKVRFPLIQEIQFALFGASMPIWLIEGDAVYTETELTPAGRGRMPAWKKEFRANLLTGKNYSYSKYFFGSYKDNVPDYYRMGYFMAAHIRENYPDSVYRKILRSAILRAPMPGAFSSSLNRYIGMPNAGLFKASTATLRQRWENEGVQLETVSYPALNHRNKDVKTDYFHPHPLDGQAVISLRRGYGHAPAFVRIDSSGRERKILSIGPQTAPWFDYAAGKIVWDEIKYDPRYRYRDYSVINTYDLDRGAFRQLTHRSRLFSPSLSADGKKIIAVKIGTDNVHSLVLLETATGRELWESPKFSEQIHHPALDEPGERVVFMLTGERGRSMGIYRIETGQFQTIREADYFDSGFPQFAGEEIVFQSHYDGVGNLYLYDPDSGTTRQLTRALFEASHPQYNPRDRSLLFNHFVPQGMDIARISLDSADGILREIPGQRPPDFPGPKVEQNGRAVSVSYPVSNYKGAGRLFNFHSVSPTAGVNDDDNYFLGLRLKSNNLLNTLSFQTGYNYNLSLQSSEYTAGIAFKRYYPVFSADYINRMREAVSGTGAQARPFTWREHEVEFSAAVPLSFTKRNYGYGIYLSTGSSYTSRYHLPDAPAGFIREIGFPWINRFLFTRQQIKSPRDLAPRFAQTVSVLHRSLALDKRLSGNLFAVRSLFIFPGLFRHHSFSAGFNFQESDGQYRFTNEIPEISGASQLPRVRPLKNTLLLDYRFPLAYPDLELGTIAYIKRIKAGLFADYENLGRSDAPDSFGFEFRADAHFFRLYMPEFDIGTKVVFFRNKEVKSPFFELILNYNLAL